MSDGSYQDQWRNDAETAKRRRRLWRFALAVVGILILWPVLEVVAKMVFGLVAATAGILVGFAAAGLAALVILAAWIVVGLAMLLFIGVAVS